MSIKIFMKTLHIFSLPKLNLIQYCDSGPITNKRFQITPLSKNFEFPPISNLFKFSAQGHGLDNFVGNGTKVKIPSEIKPHLPCKTFPQLPRNNYFSLNKIWKIVTTNNQKFLSYLLILKMRAH